MHTIHVSVEGGDSNGPILQHYSCVETGHHVTIRSDERYFTIYDRNDKPCGTIIRPRVYTDSRVWEVATTDGKTVVKTYLGANSAFRRFLIHLELEAAHNRSNALIGASN